MEFGSSEMIETIRELPSNIVGVRATGWVRANDYERVLIPTVEAALKKHDKIRLYYELGDDFRGIELGAMFEDLRIGLSKLAHWEKFAIVTDVGWIQRAVSVFRFLVPGSVKVFPTVRSREALRWIAQT
jgi:hypothetical protein